MIKLKNDNKGFSLIEVAIAIVVIGLIASFSMKGKELIHSAKINSTIEQVNSFKLSFQMYIDKNNSFPGKIDDEENSYSITSFDEVKKFWQSLIDDDFLTTSLNNGCPVSKIGGNYSISSNIPNHDGVWIILHGGTSDNKSFSGIVSQEDAYRIDKQMDTGIPNSGEVRTLKAANMESIGDKYEVKGKTKDCIIIFKIW